MNKPLLALFAFAVLSLPLSAWSCATHQFICNQAGYPQLDCCLADKNQTPSAYYHHCEGGPNSPECAAMQKAEEFLTQNRTEIFAHLLADSNCPVHQFSTDYDSCHGKFEDKVNAFVKANATGWNYSLECPIKNSNQTVLFFANESTLSEIALLLNGRLNAYYNSNTSLATPTPEPSLFASVSPTAAPASGTDFIQQFFSELSKALQAFFSQLQGLLGVKA